VALAHPTPGHAPPGEAKKPDKTHPKQAKPYGKYCHGESKKQVKGEKGTPFSQCVTAMGQTPQWQRLEPDHRVQGPQREARQGHEGEAV
jgi:hypothetical protein